MKSCLQRREHMTGNLVDVPDNSKSVPTLMGNGAGRRQDEVMYIVTQQIPIMGSMAYYIHGLTELTRLHRKLTLISTRPAMMTPTEE